MKNDSSSTKLSGTLAGEWTGRTLSHYSILEKIGEGGMGEVYEAEDSKLSRRVALKVLPQEFAQDPDRLARFRREAKCLATLDHPNIVTIHSVEEDGGVHFFTMALVQGSTLGDIIPDGGMDAQRLFEIAQPIAEALAAAHDKGITHRDLKPGNIMISEAGRLKILDFGLAKVQQGSRRQGETQLATLTLTEDGSLVGTLPYMSPEQLEGVNVDHRSDVFSLGAVLYEMATGQRPFRADTKAALASSILRDTPTSVEILRSDLPRHLSRIISQCLEKDPDERFQSARDVFNQLRVLRREMDGSGQTNGSALSLPGAPPTMRHRIRWPTIATAVVALAFAAGWLIPRLQSTSTGTGVDAPSSVVTSSNRKMIAVLPFENLGSAEDAYFADGIVEEITSRLAGVSGLGVISRRSVQQYERSGKGIRQVGTELGVGYVLEGTIRWAHAAEGPSRVRITPQLIRVGDDTQMWSESYDRVLQDIFNVQTDIAQAVLDRLGVTLLESESYSAAGRRTENLEAYDNFLKGGEYLRRAWELYHARDVQIAVEFYEKAVDLDPEFALGLAKLAVANGEMYFKYIDRSPERLERTRELATRALDLAPDLPEGHLALGHYFRDRLEYDLALQEYQQAQRGRPADSEIAEAIAQIHWYRGETAEAISSYERASALDPQRAGLYCSTGGVYRMRGDFPQSEELHERTIAIRPERSCPYFCLANIYLNWKGPERARSYLESVPETVDLEDKPPIAYFWYLLETIDGRYEAALERLDSGGAEHYDFLWFYYPKALLRAHVQGFLGRSKLAQAYYEEALGILKTELDQRPGDARLQGALGIAYAGLGLREEAIQHGRQAIELVPHGKDRFAGPYYLKEMAHIYTLLGDFDAALDTLEILLSMPSQVHVPEIQLDPIWIPLRENPRFKALRRSYSRDLAHA